jgi:hypothetical protein
MEGETRVALLQGEDGENDLHSLYTEAGYADGDEKILLSDREQLSSYIYSEAGYGEGDAKIVIKDPWKLIYVPETKIQKLLTGAPFELYNMQDDPQERENLIGVEPLVAEELKKALFARMERRESTAERPLSVSITVDHATEAAVKSLGYVQ